MCGIVGLLGPELAAQGDGPAIQMLDALAHRGPDGSALASRANCRLGLRRLAIIDVAAPSEPFTNEDGTVICVCNGQIYNSAELRRVLEGRGHVFRTSVDTEVILHLWEEHGPDLVQRLNGMFAFGIWDDRRQTLMLGRDRAGEKPLFYWADGGRLLFASEIRALLAHPSIPELAVPGSESTARNGSSPRWGLSLASAALIEVVAIGSARSSSRRPGVTVISSRTISTGAESAGGARTTTSRPSSTSSARRPWGRRSSSRTSRDEVPRGSESTRIPSRTTLLEKNTGSPRAWRSCRAVTRLRPRKLVPPHCPDRPAPQAVCANRTQAASRAHAIERRARDRLVNVSLPGNAKDPERLRLLYLGAANGEPE